MLRVAIPSRDEKGLESSIEDHFGRSNYFTIVDVVNGEIVRVIVLVNPFKEHRYGDIPQFLKSHGVDVVLAKRMGLRAQDFFKKLGIKVELGFEGLVSEVVREYLSRLNQGTRQR